MAHLEHLVAYAVWELEVVRILIILVNSHSISIRNDSHIVSGLRTSLDFKAVNTCLSEIVYVVYHAHIL